MLVKWEQGDLVLLDVSGLFPYECVPELTFLLEPRGYAFATALEGREAGFGRAVGSGWEGG